MPGARDSAYALRAAVMRYPALPLAVAGIGVFVWFASSNAGYDVTTWCPGALIFLGLVVVAVVAVPRSTLPRPAAVAIAALALYAAWSYLSIAWAAQKGDAWDGANRTTLYALVFALFAAWRPRARPAAVLLGLYVLAVSTIGLVELLRSSATAHPRDFFLEGRFASPAGYQNANVALWFSAFWPGVALAARREVHAALRGLLVSAAVLLAGLAVLGQSRGWLFTAPFAVLVFVAIVPRRVRTTLTLALVAAAVGAVAPALLHPYQRAGEPGFADAVSTAVVSLIVAAVVAGAVMAAAALVDRRTQVSPAGGRRAGIALAAVAVVAALAGLGAFAAVEGSPFHALSKAWHEFKTRPSPRGGASRFGQSLGSNRYDFWRVAVNRFAHAPLQGIGSDNFQQAYVARRHSNEEPKYPHSFELRALSETGLVGTALIATALVAALMAAADAIRRRSGLGSAVAAAATGSFAYWLLHGSVDWFWEYPALGAAAFAMLGMAAGLVPARPVPRARTAARRPLLSGTAAAALLAAALVPGWSFAAPWISKLETDSAIAVYNASGRAKYGRLDTAASLNPLSAEPKLVAASIALRLGQTGRAIRYFRDAIGRDPGDYYGRMELGALLMQTGQRAEATVQVARAVALNPRDDIVASVWRRVRHGRTVNITAVNEELARRAAERAR